MSSGWDKFRVYKYGRDYYCTTLDILHEECGYICSWCSGSGEGMADGTTCRHCKGSGEITCGPSTTCWFEVEWSKDDLSDLEVTDGDPIECEACGHNFMEDILEELKWLKQHGKNS